MGAESCDPFSETTTREGEEQQGDRGAEGKGESEDESLRPDPSSGARNGNGGENRAGTVTSRLFVQLENMNNGIERSREEAR